MTPACGFFKSEENGEPDLYDLYFDFDEQVYRCPFSGCGFFHKQKSKVMQHYQRTHQRILQKGVIL